MEEDHIIKSHNKTFLLYHIVCVVKYRRKALTKEVEKTLRNICLEIQARYEIHFVEIGKECDHIHFLVQSVPMLSQKQIVQTIKSITAREIFKEHQDVKKILWGGQFWTKGYYVNTAGYHLRQETIKNYIKNQGREVKNYKQILVNQPTLFDSLE